MAKGVEDRDERAARQEDPPKKPADLPKVSWVASLKRAGKEFSEDNATDWAAALTYYAVLSVFPAVVALVSLLGVIGQGPQTTNALLQIVGELASPSAVETLRGPIQGVVDAQGGAAALLSVGLLGAIWSASGYFGAFFRASSAAWDVEEARPATRLIPLRIAVTVLMLVLFALVVIGITVSGPVAEAVGGVIGLGDAAILTWQVAKWPVVLLALMGMVAILFHVSPNVRHPSLRWVSWGGVVAVLAWVLASAAFAVYVANFSSYGSTYGSLGGIIVFLLWVWISNCALLFGAQFDAELERSRQMREGVPADQEPFLPPRTEPA